MNDWAPEPRPVPEELTEAYQAEPYRDPWNSIMERLDKATMLQLRELMRGGIGEPLTTDELTAKEREATIAAGQIVNAIFDNE